MSWIEQSDMTPLLNAYANLEVFGVRGGYRLRFSSLRHEKLKRLDVQASDLSRETMADICAAH
ncbi:MAG: HEAT repeat domain-containing protein, partial [Ardenticatenaceae bacterium]